MIETRSVLFRKAGLGAEAFEQLCVFLGRDERSTLRIRDISASDFESLKTFCSNLGIDLSKSANRKRGAGVRVGATVSYSKAEMAAAQYVELARGESIAHAVSSINGTLKRDESFAERSEKEIGYVDNGRFGVREELKKELEREQMTGVDFAPMEIEGGWGKQENRIYELRSTIVLPPMASFCINNRGEVLSPGDFSKSDDGLYVLDGLVSDSRISFDFEEMPEFDLAITRERFGPVAAQAVPRLICSNRFYRKLDSMCSSLEWKMVLPLQERYVPGT